MLTTFSLVLIAAMTVVRSQFTGEEVPTDIAFTCTDLLSGFYADPVYNCQVFHVCVLGRRRASLLCPSGTAFNQRLFTCTWEAYTNCAEAPDYYIMNSRLYNQNDPSVRSELLSNRIDRGNQSPVLQSLARTLNVATSGDQGKQPQVQVSVIPDRKFQAPIEQKPFRTLSKIDDQLSLVDDDLLDNSNPKQLFDDDISDEGNSDTDDDYVQSRDIYVPAVTFTLPEIDDLND